MEINEIKTVRTIFDHYVTVEAAQSAAILLAGGTPATTAILSLVNRCRFRAGENFLETRIVSQRIPFPALPQI